MSSGGVHLTLRPQMVEDKLFSYSVVCSAEGTEHPNKEGQKAGDLYLLAAQGQNVRGARCQEPGLGHPPPWRQSPRLEPSVSPQCT